MGFPRCSRLVGSDYGPAGLSLSGGHTDPKARSGDRPAHQSRAPLIDETPRILEEETFMDDAVAIEVVEERDPQAYGFTIKTRANGLLHRVLPLRDPRQPRFWCVVVYRCSSGGLADISEQPWIGSRGLLREDLKATMAAIRADPSAWLAEAAHGQLRDWLLTPVGTADPADPRSSPATSGIDAPAHVAVKSPRGEPTDPGRRSRLEEGTPWQESF